MKYAGFRINKIEAERDEEKTPSGNINVNSNFNLGKSKKEELKKEMKNPIFGFEFTYTIKYEEFATISFKGVVYIELESEDKNLLKELDSSKVSDNEIRKFILDIVLAKTHVESLHLEEKLGLPFHIQSPRVKFGED